MTTRPGGRARDLLRAAALAVTFALLYVVGVLSPWGQRADEFLLGFVAGRLGLPGPVAGIVREAVVVALAALVVALGLLALRHGRWTATGGMVLLCLAAPALSVWLRDVLLARPFHDETYGYAYNTYPSTHVTAVAVLGVAVLVLWPSRTLRRHTVVRRTVLAVVVLACLANVVAFAHRPADVVGSLLLVASLASLLAAAMPGTFRPARRRFHPAPQESSPVPAD
ncbi:hypothetical protein ATJ88_2925 [Isoptericola jiangsuensis]|uniref:PAP2 superfamily protein n=1 Tax=Isoptericola jiangsuensis TaxID=548579 RepID=A0A2A9F089_9MICO|nr:hypothetical protein [Isoptericola jiangsuensis]PFG44206.1 hypothetical protein ATJ88_2925 [Isoptericola jiangsuensis]